MQFHARFRGVNYWRFKSLLNRQWFTHRKIALKIAAKIASVNGPLSFPLFISSLLSSPHFLSFPFPSSLPLSSPVFLPLTGHTKLRVVFCYSTTRTEMEVCAMCLRWPCGTVKSLASCAYDLVRLKSKAVHKWTRQFENRAADVGWTVTHFRETLQLKGERISLESNYQF